MKMFKLYESSADCTLFYTIFVILLFVIIVIFVEGLRGVKEDGSGIAQSEWRLATGWTTEGSEFKSR
jgi:hypothetical protein